MWIEKLFSGILEVDTPLGPRYLQPSLLERAFLIWTFRNFPSLPQQVLNEWEQRLIDRLWSDHRFVSVSVAEGPTQPVIGKVERRPIVPAEEATPRRPMSGSQATVREQGREAASA